MNGRRYGYKAEEDGTLVPVPAEQRIINRIKRLKSDEGFSLQKIADSLNEESHPAPRGGRWGKSSVRSVINNNE